MVGYWGAGHPLFSATHDLLKQQQALLVVSLTGLDEALLQTIPARHVYHPEEILFKKRLADILKPTDDGTMWMVDSSQLNAVVEDPFRSAVAQTSANAQENQLIVLEGNLFEKASGKPRKA